MISPRTHRCVGKFTSRPAEKPHSSLASCSSSALIVVIQKHRCISSTASVIGLNR